jgi:hypothetical protein
MKGKTDGELTMAIEAWGTGGTKLSGLKIG